MSVPDFEAIRGVEFPNICGTSAPGGGRIFLNSASTGPLPGRSIAAAAEYLRRRGDPTNISDAEIFSTLARSRALIAGLLKCTAEEVALVPNTSFGINLAANALPLRSGDVVLTFEREFPANVYPWMALRRKGVELRFVPCVKGVPDMNRFLEALNDPGVRVAAVSWVSFATGYKVDLELLGRECKERGVFLVVDAIQGVGAATLDLSALNIDVLACGCQKWLLSPWGTGFVYVRRALVEELVPGYVGWLAMASSLDFTSLTSYEFDLLPDARRFEVGTHALQDYAALNESLSLFLELGIDNIAARVEELTASLVNWGAGRESVTLFTPRDGGARGGIVSLAVPELSRVAGVLRDEGITISVRDGTLRFAPHFFNTAEEMERVTALLDRELP